MTVTNTENLVTSNLLFGRNARVIAGPKGKESLDIRNLRIAFNVAKTSDTDPNRSSVKIWNLKRENRELIQQSNVERGLILFTGYNNELSICSLGTVTRVVTVKTGPDIITTIEYGDGETAIKESQSNTSLPAGTPFSGIIGTLISDLGLAVKTISGTKEEISNTGEVLNGNTATLLTQYLNKQDLEWSVQNEQLVIKPVARGVNDIDITILTNNNGLLGAPERREKGINLTTLHDPKIEPGKIIQLETREFSGFFVCRLVSHSGDTHQGEYETHIEAIELGS